MVRNLFGSVTDTVITIICAVVLVWLAYHVIDWAFISSVWRAEDEPLCREASGACWSVIDARHRIILFGLFPYEEHWRSALACLVIIVTVIASCFSWFWTVKRLAPLWITGFALFYLLMHGGLFGLSVITPERWGGLALTIFIFASVSLMGYIQLPQAFRNALPSIINQFVITFKETSIVTIVGFFEVLASGHAAYGTGEWTPHYIEVYVFIGLIYFIFVFLLSRYGAYLEKRLRVGHG